MVHNFLFINIKSDIKFRCKKIKENFLKTIYFFALFAEISKAK